MDPHRGHARPAARLTVLASPSGVGKHSVIEAVRARAPEVWLPVPVTTRPRRGREGTFVDSSEFQRMVHAGELLEWAEVGGRRYGTPREPVESRLRAGIPVLLSVDVAGARQVRQAMPTAHVVLLTHPDRTTAEPSLEWDTTIVVDSVARAAAELVGLLGSPALL